MRELLNWWNHQNVSNGRQNLSRRQPTDTLLCKKLPQLLLAELRQFDPRIQKPMQRFCSLWQFVQITFQNLGKAVEQCPERPGLEFLMSRIAPLS